MVVTPFNYELSITITLKAAKIQLLLLPDLEKNSDRLFIFEGELFIYYLLIILDSAE